MRDLLEAGNWRLVYKTSPKEEADVHADKKCDILKWHKWGRDGDLKGQIGLLPEQKDLYIKIK